MFSDAYAGFYYVLLIAASVACLFFIKKAQKGFRLLTFLILLTFLNELIARYVVVVLHKHNNAVYNIFTPIEFLFYILVYKQLFNSKKWNYILWLFFAVFMAAYVFNVIFFQPLSTSNTNILILEGILMEFLSLSLFIKIRNSNQYENLLDEGVFWFNSIVLLYYTMSCMIWGFHSIKVYLLQNPPMIIYNFLLIFNGVLYAVYAFAVGLNSVTTKKRLLQHD